MFQPNWYTTEIFASERQTRDQSAAHQHRLAQVIRQGGQCVRYAQPQPPLLRRIQCLTLWLLQLAG